MFRSILAMFSTLKVARNAPRTKRKLGCERLETRDTPASIGMDDIARASKTVSHNRIDETYEIDRSHAATSKVIKQVAKRNTLTAKNLSAGHYSVH